MGTESTTWVFHIDYSLRVATREVEELLRESLGPDWSIKRRSHTSGVSLCTTWAASSVRVATQAVTRRLELASAAIGLDDEPRSIRIHPSRVPDQIPELIALAEAARLLGVSRQRARQLALRPDFPAPVARLATGPVYLLEGVELFQAGWIRKPGRPARTATPQP
jgi:hypothetical protein